MKGAGVASLAPAGYQAQHKAVAHARHDSAVARAGLG
jgi:hypothetical protein